MNFNFYVYTIQWPKEKRTKEQILIYKALHRKQKIEEYEPHEKFRCS